MAGTTDKASGFSSPPILRPATNADAPAVRALIYAALAEHGLAPDPAGTDADLADIAGNFACRGGVFAVLDLGGEVVGSVALYRVSAECCELRKMYLAPAQRGRGLGRVLLDHALAEARRLGFRRVTLETASVLVAAVKLYERYGFRPVCGGHVESSRCDRVYALDLPP